MAVKIDVVCPLFRAERVIDRLIEGIRSQEGVEIGSAVFPVTETGDDLVVLGKLAEAGFVSFPVKKFSHSLTRERAIRDYCGSERVIMLSQDVLFSRRDAFLRLAEFLRGDVAYAFGRQIGRCGIERYVREKNYGENSFVTRAEDLKREGLFGLFASDAFSAYLRPVFLALGGYGADMNTNEDMFYAKKVLDAGYAKGYCAEACVLHSHKLSLRALYARYRRTGEWFVRFPEFDEFRTSSAGAALALGVLKSALARCDLPSLLRFLPDMSARYLGMRRGRREGGTA